MDKLTDEEKLDLCRKEYNEALVTGTQEQIQYMHTKYHELQQKLITKMFTEE